MIFIDKIQDYLSLIKELLIWFSTQPILVVILFIYLIGATYTDVKSLKVYDKYNLIFFGIFIAYLIGVASFDTGLGIERLAIWMHIGGLIVAFLALLIPAMALMHKMGGDIKLVSVIGFVIGLPLFFPFFVITCILAMIYGFSRKFIFKKEVMKFPFAPFFLGSLVVLTIITLFIL